MNKTSKKQKIFQLFKTYALPIGTNLLIITKSFPAFAFPEGEVAADNEVPKTGLEKAKIVITSALGLKALVDPCASPAKKSISVAKFSCCLVGLGLGGITGFVPEGTRLHRQMATCCAASWAGYAVLSYVDKPVQCIPGVKAD